MFNGLGKVDAVLGPVDWSIFDSVLRRIENELFDADYERIMPWLENALERMPVLAESGIRREVHGAIARII